MKKVQEPKNLLKSMILH